MDEKTRSEAQKTLSSPGKETRTSAAGQEDSPARENTGDVAHTTTADEGGGGVRQVVR